MVRRWRLKLICICVLFSISAFLSNQINLTFNFTPNKSIQRILNSEIAGLHHNKLSYVEESVVKDKRSEFGLSHLVVVNQSRYKKDHRPRKKDDDEVERGNSEDYSKQSDRGMHDYMFELTQVIVDDIVSSWDSKKLTLSVEHDCWVSQSGGHSILEDGVLKVCLSPSLLMKEFDPNGLSKSHLKLLVLHYILNELGSDNVNALLETSEETEEFNRMVTTVISDLSLKGKELLKSSNPTLNLHMSSQPTLTHHMPSPALISQKLLSNSALRDIPMPRNAGPNVNEHRSYVVQEHPSQMAKDHLIHEYADQRTTQTKIQELQTSHSNFNKFRLPSHGEKGRSVLFSIPNLMASKINNNKSILERGFHMDYGFDSPELLQRRKYITAALEGPSVLQRNVARVSLNSNLLERGKHQREQIQRYCKSENMSSFLPENFMELNILFKHLLYDDSKKIVFCYVPKNGCSNMKRMMLILNGIIPANSSQESRPSESVLGLVHSFRNLSREAAIYRLENYFKFSILRNPMERLLSAYRNKLEKPLNFTRVKKFPDRLKAFILALKRKSALQEWVALKNYSNDIHPSFSDTLEFMTKFTLTAYNEHFLPFLKLCHPCAIKYDLFLNLKSMNYDIFALMEYMDIPLQYFPGVFKSSDTRDFLEEYYQQVSPKVMTRVYNTLGKELKFYYDMYPEEL